MDCYHGSEDAIEDFLASERGTLGPGIYFAESARSASAYGDCVTLAQVTLQNPWRIDLDYESQGATNEDFDSPCVEAILSLPGGRQMMNQAKASDGKYDTELQNTLKAIGYDGIVGTYPDGSQEIVAFDTAQIQVLGIQPKSTTQGRQPSP